jgi:serine/threonine-protein phosphatase 6 regulatory ankyrin repeat subunit A/serine/threonine-protein phosphatase 6 regulatory ankyrin repeat subunit B
VIDYRKNSHMKTVKSLKNISTSGQLEREIWLEQKAQFVARRLLKKKGLDCTVADFLASVAEGNAKIIRLFINAGMDVNATECGGGNTKFMCTALIGPFSTVDPQQYGGGTTALMCAASNGYTEIVETLLIYGAEINAKNNNNEPIFFDNGEPIFSGLDLAFGGEYGATALMYAASNGHTEIIKILLTHGAEINVKKNNGETALMAAVTSRLESLETVQILLDYKAEVNAKDHQGTTALMKTYSRVKIAQLLLDYGADVNAKDNDNVTALMEASGADTIETVRTLLAYGAEVNAVTHDGYTALMMASLRWQLENVQALLAQGAEVNVKDHFGGTALIYAAMMDENTEIVKLLLAHGAEVEAKDHEGKTALIHAAWSNDNQEKVNVLLAHGAKIDATDNEGNTALSVAWKYRQAEIIRILQKHMDKNSKILPTADFLKIQDEHTG